MRLALSPAEVAHFHALVRTLFTTLSPLLIRHWDPLTLSALQHTCVACWAILLCLVRADAAYFGLAPYLADLVRLLDELEDGFLLLDPGGYVLHQTPAMRRMLDAEPEREGLCKGIEQVAQALRRQAAQLASESSVPSPLARKLRTADHCVQGRHLRHPGLGPGLTLVIRVQCLWPRPLSDEALQRRYRLTGREVEVARLLALGRPTESVARQLGLSPHTVARHAEHVFRKLDVHSRVELGARLRGDAAELG